MKEIMRSVSRILATMALLMPCMLTSISLHAQNNLIVTMVQQILKLETAYQELKQGYAIVHQGLSTITDIKKGDFDLHQLFFNSLVRVNPAIKNYGKVGDIVAMQLQILQGCSTTFPQFIRSGAFSAADLQYIATVYKNLKKLTEHDIDELTAVLSNDQWAMTDDERIARIDRLFKSVEEKYLFLRSFADLAGQQALWRQHEKQTLQNLQKLIQP